MKYYFFLCAFLFITCTDEKTYLYKKGNGVTDIDGNFYSSIIISDQEWMASNLKTTKYSNGDFITNTPNDSWGSESSGAWCYYENDPNMNLDYGKLYNWFAIFDERKICPVGWHVPSDNDWSVLGDFLGGFEIAGGKMKKKDTEYWIEPNLGATNKSGFNAVAGGNRRGAINSVFETFGNLGRYWSSSDLNSDEAWGYDLSNENTALTINQFNKTYGFSCRCIKD